MSESQEHVAGIVTSLGRIYAPEGKRALPRKQPLRHRWIAVTSFILSEEQAEGMYSDNSRVILDGTNLWDLSVGCIDCEEIYPDAKDTKCRAPEYREPGT